MKSKLIVSLGVLLLLGGLWAVDALGCGYYFNWYPEDDCNQTCTEQGKGTSHVEGGGCDMCSCCQPGARETCEEFLDETCGTCVEFGTHKYETGCDYDPNPYSPVRCEECREKEQ